jgi:hypothetical protein
MTNVENTIANLIIYLCNVGDREFSTMYTVCFWSKIDSYSMFYCDAYLSLCCWKLKTDLTRNGGKEILVLSKFPLTVIKKEKTIFFWKCYLYFVIDCVPLLQTAARIQWAKRILKCGCYVARLSVQKDKDGTSGRYRTVKRDMYLRTKKFQ